MRKSDNPVQRLWFDRMKTDMIGSRGHVEHLATPCRHGASYGPIIVFLAWNRDRFLMTPSSVEHESVNGNRVVLVGFRLHVEAPALIFSEKLRPNDTALWKRHRNRAAVRVIDPNVTDLVPPIDRGNESLSVSTKETLRHALSELGLGRLGQCPGGDCGRLLYRLPHFRVCRCYRRPPASVPDSSIEMNRL